MMYNNYSNRYTTTAYAPRQQQQQSMGQGFAFGANNFFGNQAGANNFFTSPSGFFGNGANQFASQSQSAAQSAGIFNMPTMNVNFGSTGSDNSYGIPGQPGYQGNSGYIDWSRPRPTGFTPYPPRPTGLTPYPPGYDGSGKPPMPYGNDALMPPYGGNYDKPHKPYFPSQPMPQPPVVPQGNYCPPTYKPPVPPYCPPPVKPPVYPPPVHPPAPPVQTNYVGLAGDPIGYGQDLPGQTIGAPQNTGYHNLYANGEGFAGYAAGGQLAGILNRQQPLTAFGTAVQTANAQGLYQAVPNGGIAVNSLVEQLNAKEPNKVANTQYGVTVGDYRVQLAGGLTQVIKPDGSTVTLKPDGTPFQLGNLATLRAGVTLPGAGEARTVLAYNEALKQGGTSTDLLTWGFRTPDGLGATERASAGYADGVQRLASNGNLNYYDFQVIQNAQANQLA